MIKFVAGIAGVLLAALLTWAASTLVSTSTAVEVHETQIGNLEKDISEIKTDVREIREWTRKN